MDAPVAGFEWDKGNLEHCQKHGVSRTEAESVFVGPVIILPDETHSQTERRLRAIGRTEGGRPVFLVFMIRERGGLRYIRPISVRYMHRKEIEFYETENPAF